MGSRNPFNVEVLRGAVVESVHQVMAIVVDENRRVMNSWGNINFLTMPRSSIKMLQALPLIESGAVDKFGLTDKHICLACASHHSEKEHLAVLQDWMKKADLSEGQLACGAHAPMDTVTAHELIRRGTAPTPLMNNCSGKHFGIITVAKHLGESAEGYENFDHSAQKRLRTVLGETMRIDHNKVPFGTDGCGIPTYAVPLQNIAFGMAALINPKEPDVRLVAAKRVLQAVKNEPFYVSGSKDFGYAVIKQTNGRAIIKGGAEGVYTGLIPERGLAFAVKAADGGRRAAEFVTAHILKAYAGLTQSEFDDLREFTQPVIKNWKGTEVGKIRLEANP